jgi:hypothetical protein
VVRRRALVVGRSSTNGGEDEEELDEAVAMSSTSGRDELDESGVEELGDEDHDGEDEDSGEELDAWARVRNRR